MKVEPRGKFGGVKIHLDPEECNNLLTAQEFIDIDHLASDEFLLKLSKEGGDSGSLIGIKVPVEMAAKMGRKIRKLLAEQPDLLGERTPEQVIAILAKETEKSALQLAQAKAGTDFTKVDAAVLQAALLKHVPKG